MKPLVCLALLAAGCGVLPQDSPLPWQAQSEESSLLRAYRAIYADYDRNRDGVWDEGEFPGARTLDADLDGRVTWEEARPTADILKWQSDMMRQEAEQLFSQADLDGDGELSAREAEQDPIVQSLDLQAEGLDRMAFGQRFFDTLHIKLREASLRHPVSRGRKKVVILHGVWAPGWYYLYPMVRHLEKQGYSVSGLNFWPTVNDIRIFSKHVQQHVERIRRPGEQVSLVAHSMGGLVGRYYVQNLGGTGAVDHLVTFATPHFGSQLARLFPIGIARQFAPDSPFLNALNQKTQWPPTRYHCIWTKTDGIVVPAKNAVLPTAEVFPAIPVSHHHLVVYSPKAWGYMDQALTNH